MSTPEIATMAFRGITTECGEFIVLFEQVFDRRRFLAIIPKDAAKAFLEGECPPDRGPELVEERDQAVWPLTEEDRNRFIRRTYKQVEPYYADGTNG